MAAPACGVFARRTYTDGATFATDSPLISAIPSPQSSGPAIVDASLVRRLASSPACTAVSSALLDALNAHGEHHAPQGPRHRNPLR